jgi:tRNA(adenine34) deaminase
MARAMARADFAGEQGEVPVGAVLVAGGDILGAGANAIEAHQDATAHAEMQALRQAAAAVASRRLTGTTLYVTLEPCAMCAGALVLARVARVVFGAWDPKGGACGTLRNVVRDPRLNHRCQVLGGVMEKDCAAQLRVFFARLRSE